MTSAPSPAADDPAAALSRADAVQPAHHAFIPLAHKDCFALFDMDRQFADVVPVADVVRYLEALAQSSAREAVDAQ